MKYFKGKPRSLWNSWQVQEISGLLKYRKEVCQGGCSYLPSKGYAHIWSCIVDFCRKGDEEGDEENSKSEEENEGEEEEADGSKGDGGTEVLWSLLSKRFPLKEQGQEETPLQAELQ